MQVNETYTEKLTSIRTEFNTPINADKVLLLVEGADDKKVFVNFCNEQTVLIHFMEGKGKVEHSLNDLTEIIWRIGIRDADFLHLDGRPSPLPNLFLTDVHDLELLMLHADDVFKKIKNENNIGNDARQHVLETATFLAYFRWYNEKNSCYNEENEEIGFSFKNLPLNKIYKNGNLDKTTIVKAVIEQSKEPPKTDIDEIIMEVEQLKNTAHDLWQLCNGHDCIKILAAYITSNNSKNAINDTKLAQQIRLTYHRTDFKQTKLYDDVNAWAITHGLHLFK